jgi:hypothetical protein
MSRPWVLRLSSLAALEPFLLTSVPAQVWPIDHVIRGFAERQPAASQSELWLFEGECFGNTVSLRAVLPLIIMRSPRERPKRQRVSVRLPRHHGRENRSAAISTITPCRRTVPRCTSSVTPEHWQRSLPRRSQKDGMTWSGSRGWQTTGFPNRESCIPGRKGGSPSNTQGGSRMPELGTYGSVRGALSSERPYRDPGAPTASNDLPVKRHPLGLLWIPPTQMAAAKSRFSPAPRPRSARDYRRALKAKSFYTSGSRLLTNTRKAT